MKKLTAFFLMAALASCNTGDDKTNAGDTTAGATPNKAAVSYAYPIRYSANFEMGDPAKGQKITELWKDFDNNTLDNQTSSFADTVTMEMPGMMFTGTRDTVMKMTKEYRGTIKSMKSAVDVVMTTKAPDVDKDGSWVSIWGSEVVVNNNGTTDSSKLHENWHFNKDGKIDYIMQYRMQYPKPGK